MLDKIRATIEKYNMLSYGDKIIIGVSGGADSVCLTDVLNSLKEEYNLDITLVHINHNIRGEEAQRDEEYVIELGEVYGNNVKVFSYEVEAMAKAEGMTVEEMGRKLRYDAFYKTAGKDGKIAVAHNMNDNCETMIMRFLRGTGIKGLGGILAARDRIIRPLINITRAEIEAYCTAKGLEYCTDSTNSVEEYTRNKIRLNIIPMIQRDFNENIVAAMARMSELMTDEERYMEGIAKKAYKECEIEDNRISVDRLLQYDRVIQRRIIRLGFVDYSADLHDISYEHVERVLSLTEKESGKVIELPNNLRAVKEHNTIYFYKVGENRDFAYDIETGKEYDFRELGMGMLISSEKYNGNLKKVYTIPLDYDKINTGLQIRSRRPGDKISLYGGTKTIKKLFIDEKVPLSKRDNIPLLAAGNNIVWVKDMKTSAYFKAAEDCENVLYLYLWEV